MQRAVSNTHAHTFTCAHTHARAQRHGKRTFARKPTYGLASSTELTTHAVVQALVEACATQHAMSMAGGARYCLLFIDAVCATAAAAVTTICEGVNMARDKPIVAHSAASM